MTAFYWNANDCRLNSCAILEWWYALRESASFCVLIIVSYNFEQLLMHLFIDTLNYICDMILPPELITGGISYFAYFIYLRRSQNNPVLSDCNLYMSVSTFSRVVCPGVAFSCVPHKLLQLCKVLSSIGCCNEAFQSGRYPRRPRYCTSGKASSVGFTSRK